jgi:hypothetical protein
MRAEHFSQESANLAGKFWREHFRNGDDLNGKWQKICRWSFLESRQAEPRGAQFFAIPVFYKPTEGVNTIVIIFSIFSHYTVGKMAICFEKQCGIVIMLITML